MEKETVTVHASACRLSHNSEIVRPNTAQANMAPTFGGFDDQDILSVAAVMVHAGVRNVNGDGFKQADLEWALEEFGVFNPDRPGILDDAHDMIAYGAWTRSFSIRHEGHFAIQTEGAIWAWKYPAFAKMVWNYYNAGTLSFSMMCTFEFAECSECGEYFANTVSPERYCDHLVGRIDNGATRWLRYPHFLTNSRVDDPADKSADGLVVASDIGHVISEDSFEKLSPADKLAAYYSMAKML